MYKFLAPLGFIDYIYSDFIFNLNIYIFDKKILFDYNKYMPNNISTNNQILIKNSDSTPNLVHSKWLQQASSKINNIDNMLSNIYESISKLDDKAKKKVIIFLWSRSWQEWYFLWSKYFAEDKISYICNKNIYNRYPTWSNTIISKIKNIIWTNHPDYGKYSKN